MRVTRVLALRLAVPGVLLGVFLLADHATSQTVPRQPEGPPLGFLRTA